MIAIVDYGRGNLYSLSHALRHLGAEHIVTDEPAGLLRADGVILPGVGAFGDTMFALNACKLAAPLREVAERQIPLMGICLGMQVFATVGEEFGRHDGLGLVSGTVRRLPDPRRGDDAAIRIPNVGWRTLHLRQDDPLTRHARDSMMYFVHSYGLFPEKSSDVVATIPVNGQDVPVIVRCGTVVGCQFHPEKSGLAGLALLEGFVRTVVMPGTGRKVPGDIDTGLNRRSA